MSTFRKGTRRVYRPILSVVVLSIAWFWLVPAVEAQRTKMNWETGTFKIGDVEHPIRYSDAHVKLATTGLFDPRPAQRRIEQNGFHNSGSGVTPGVPDDCLTIDWAMAGGDKLEGKTHIGAEFRKIGGDLRVMDAKLTGVQIPSLGGYEAADFKVPGPTDFKTVRGQSVDWIFSISDPGLIGPVTFSSVEFYTTLVEPPLESLNAAAFPALPKTLVHVEPGFVLPPLGSHSAHIEDADPPEWLMAYYTTSWTDPTLSPIAGMPVTVEVTQWVAVQLVPEPASCMLLMIGAAFCVGLRRERGQNHACSARGDKRRQVCSVENLTFPTWMSTRHV